MDTVQSYISFSAILTLLGHEIHIEYQTQQANKKDDHHRLILGDIGRLMDSGYCIDRVGGGKEDLVALGVSLPVDGVVKSSGWLSIHSFSAASQF
jgi:hypothetical protein